MAASGRFFNSQTDLTAESSKTGRNLTGLVGLGLALGFTAAAFLKSNLTKVEKLQQEQASSAIRYRREIERLQQEQEDSTKGLRREIERLELDQESSAVEMEVAHEIQSSLMAPGLIETDHWCMAASSIPTKGVGGRFL